MDFAKELEDSAIGKVAELGSTLAGVAGAIKAALVFTGQVQSDMAILLDAIFELQQALSVDFRALGSLIKKQIHSLAQNEDILAMATALAHTKTAADKLARFLRLQESADLEVADTESDLGIQFFLSLPAQPADPTVIGDTDPTAVANQADPVFLPGIAAAGTTRIAVIGKRDPHFRTISDDVNQINRIVELFQRSISFVKLTVDEAHTIELKSHLSHAHPHGDTGEIPEVIDGYIHGEREKVFQFFSAHEARNEDDNRATRARTAADAARRQGVTHELAWIGIPGFETLLQEWKDTLNS